MGFKKLRKRLHESIEKNGLMHPETIKISQIIDRKAMVQMYSVGGNVLRYLFDNRRIG